METAAAKGCQSCPPSWRVILPVERQTMKPAHRQAAGSAISASVRGKSNHFARTVSLTIGVARLTSPTPRATHSRPQRDHASAFFCSAPSVFSTSHVAPSST